MKKTIRHFYCVIFMFSATLLSAQNKTEIIGKIVDPEGIEIIGATIMVKGTNVGTIADSKGNYKINVTDPKTSTLVFSFIGAKKKEIRVAGQTIINVTLEPSSVQLNEVVSVGYGNMKRKDLTGSVVSVNADEMQKVPTSNIAQALAGRVSGVLVTQSEGSPSSSISIRVRGGISITGNNEPLYIIDGFPSEEGLGSLDPGSIESIDILKDASSTTIYGARGANGVVVVTTKSGTQTKTTVNYDGYFGMKQLARKLGVLSPYEFVLADYERRNLNLPAEVNSFTSNYGPFADMNTNYANRPGVNWQDQAFGKTAFSQSHRISIDGGAGGANKLKYNVSYSYNKDQGQMVESGLTKNNFRIKLDHQVNNNFTATATASYTDSRVYGMGTSDGSTNYNPLSQILQYRPTMGIKGNDQDLITQIIDPLLVDDQGNVMQNPVVSAKEEHKVLEQRIIQLNGGFTYKFAKGFSFRNTTGVTYKMQRNEAFYGAQSITAKRSSIQGFIRNTDTQTSQLSNTLNYEGKTGKHKYNALIGQEYITVWTRFVEASASQFPNDDIGLADLSQGALPGIPRSYFNDDNKLLSYFARAYYNYADKYMVTATVRRDGSSKFKEPWGTFPSASVAWRASEEQFVRNLNIFSDLKVRFGYGEAGNNRIDSYGSLPIMGSVSYPINNTTQTGYASMQIPNANLKWEANKTLNLGVDLGFFNQRLTISPEFYINNSSNLLLKSEIPSSSGYPWMLQNIGQTRNVGFDLSINSVNIKSKGFEWASSLNISHNKNTIKSLSGEQSFLKESGFGFNQNDFLINVGAPIGQMYGYKSIGLYQVSDFDYDATTQKYTIKANIPYDNRKLPQPGYWKYQDVAGALDANGNSIPDGKITDADRTVIGHASPTFYGGMNNTFSYRNFDLSIFVNFSVGNDVLNATKLYNSRTGITNKNALDVSSAANRWVTVDAAGNRVTDPTALSALNAGKTVGQWGNMTLSDTYITSWGVEDGSFIRLNNVTLGYSIPRNTLKMVGLTKCRLYVTANNLCILTKYTGFDPEVSTRNSTGLTPGVDWGAYPRSSSLTFGINLSF